MLEGGIEGCPNHVIFYASSNRRHLMQRDMIENERQHSIHPAEAVEEKTSLSDRFGLWLGFHNYSQAQYLSMIDAYIKAYSIPIKAHEWQKSALQWSVARGVRSGRVAHQFILDLAGQHNINLDKIKLDTTNLVNENHE